MEELGCVVRTVERLPAHIHAYDDLTIALLPVRCELLRGEPAAIEHAEIRWVETAELEGLHWSGADVPIVRDFVANSRQAR